MRQHRTRGAERNGGRIALLIAVAFPIRGAADFAAVYGLSWVGRAVVRDLRSALFAHHLTLPSRYVETPSSGSLISTLTYNTEQVADAISGAALVRVRNALVILALFGVMLYMSPGLTLAAVIVALVVVWPLATYSSLVLRRMSGRIQASMPEFTRAVRRTLGGQRVIKAFEAQSYVLREFGKLDERNTRLHIRLTATRALSESSPPLIVAVGVATIVFVVFSTLLLSAPATFIGFITAMGMLLAPLRRLTSANAVLQRAIVAVDGVFEILDEPSELDGATCALRGPKVTSSFVTSLSPSAGQTITCSGMSADAVR